MAQTYPDTRPPFRADQVGSLLRPAALSRARERFKAGQIPADELRGIEDEAIREAVRRQQAIGLKSITDGEFRRDWWHLDFLAQLDGVSVRENPGPKFKIAGQGEQPPIASVTGRVGCSRPIMADHFAFLKSVVSQGTAKMTIPSPSMLHLRGGRASISKTVYPDLAQFWADTAAAYRVAIRHLADALRNDGADPDAIARTVGPLGVSSAPDGVTGPAFPVFTPRETGAAINAIRFGVEARY